MNIQEIADQLRERVSGAGFDHNVKFELGDEGVISIVDGKVSTEDAPADCTISISRDDFESLMAGELSPTSAFMSGKIKVAGDMSAAMALSQLL